MKSTILHLNDRLNHFLKQAKSDGIHQYRQMVKSLPLDKIEKHWDNFVENVTKKINDDFLDQIEMLNLQLKDHEETNAKLSVRNGELEFKVESEMAKQVKYIKMEDDLNFADHQIVKLNRGLIIEVRNRDHFRQLVSEQEIIIKEVQKQLEAMVVKQKEFGAKFEANQLIQKIALETKAKEAEHLATQLIRLHQENLELINKNTELNAELSKSHSETQAYKNATELQATNIARIKPYVEKLAEKWFPPVGVDYALLAADANQRQVDFELCEAKTIRIPNNPLNLHAVPPPDLKSTPESCCESKIEKDVISLKVGDRVRVPLRFGETGTIVEINPDLPNSFGVQFKNLSSTLFYKAEELQLLGPNEKGFSWFRMPEREKLQDELQALTKTYQPQDNAQIPVSVPDDAFAKLLQQTNHTKTHEENMDEFDHLVVAESDAAVASYEESLDIKHKDCQVCSRPSSEEVRHWSKEKFPLWGKTCLVHDFVGTFQDGGGRFVSSVDSTRDRAPTNTPVLCL